MPEIVSVEPGIINTTGAEVGVTLRHSEDPVFLFAGLNAPEISRTPVSADETLFVVAAPDSLAGPAALVVLNHTGGTDDPFQNQ